MDMATWVQILDKTGCIFTKNKDKVALLTELQNCKLFINWNAHELYSARKRLVHDTRGTVKAVSQTDGNNMNVGLFLGYTLLQVVDGVVGYGAATKRSLRNKVDK